MTGLIIIAILALIISNVLLWVSIIGISTLLSDLFIEEEGDNDRWGD